jgi:hypothetical protein
VALNFPNTIRKLSVVHYRRLLVSTGLLFALILNVSLIVPMLRPPVFRPVELPSDSRITDSVVLSGIQVEEKNGETRALVFQFDLSAEIPEAYRIFLHLYPADGSRMVNRDFVPQPPTKQWLAGRTVSLRRPLSITPGDYAATLGLFNSTTHLGEWVSFRCSVR